jgi:hypothetical protein
MKGTNQMEIFTKQGIRNLDHLGDNKADVLLQLTEHVCRQWRWFQPPKDAPKVVLEDGGQPETPGPEMRCVECRKLWHGEEKPEAPRVESLAKVAPGLEKKRQSSGKKTSLTKPSLKAPLVDQAGYKS